MPSSKTISHNPGDADLAYAKGLVDRINAVRVDGKSLSETTFLDGLNVWQFFQQGLLFADAKEFGKRKKNQEDWIASSQKSSLQARGAAILALLSTGIALIALLIRRPPVILFAHDKRTDPSKRHDFRLDAAYRYLKERHFPYAELLHTSFGPTLIRNLRQRGVRMYLEALTLPYVALMRAKIIAAPRIPSKDEIDLSDFTPDEAAFAYRVIVRCLTEIPRIEFRIRALTWIFHMARTRFVWMIDDPRSFFEVILAARRAGIPSFAFQHGHVTKYHVGFLHDPSFRGEIPHPTRFFVWNTYWRDEYDRLGSIYPRESIRIGRLRDGLEPIARTSDKNGIAVLMPYETDAPHQEVRAYIRAILACPDTRILFKLRPDLPAAHQARQYGLEEFPPERIEMGLGNDEMLSSASFACGTYSTYLYELIERGMPVAILATSSDFGEGMLANDLAGSLDLASAHFCADIKRIASTTASTLQKRAQKISGDEAPSFRDSLTGEIRSAMRAGR